MGRQWTKKAKEKDAAEPVAAGHCHCEDCRRTSGTGHGSHLAVPAAGFTITGEVRFFEKPADSGNVVARGFCPTCGSAVYSLNSGYEDLVFPRASSLDDPEVFVEALSANGFDGAALLEGTQDPAVKAQLLENTNEAVERGVFGIPTMFVGDEIFFGKDSLDELEDELKR